MSPDFASLDEDELNAVHPAGEPALVQTLSVVLPHTKACHLHQSNPHLCFNTLNTALHTSLQQQPSKVQPSPWEHEGHQEALPRLCPASQWDGQEQGKPGQ